jgi:hypothetical protein
MQLRRYAMHRARAVVAERPALRAVEGFERWRPEQIHPGRLEAVCQLIHNPNRIGSKRQPTKPSRLVAGDALQAVKALLVTTEFLKAQIAELQAAVSNGYARGKRKDWYD